MSRVGHMHRAKAVKDDEFYTLRKDVAHGIASFAPHLAGKRVHCNCDGPRSRFVEYLNAEFEALGLRSLLATGVNLKKQKGYRFYRDSSTREEWREVPFEKATYQATLTEPVDVVVTNPPFSLIKQFIPDVMEAGREMLAIVPVASTSKARVLPYVMDGRLHVWHVRVRWYERANGELESPGGSPGWITTFPVEPKPLPLDVAYDPRYNPIYEEIEAIEAATVHDIPNDYAGMIGVPETYLMRHDPEQFEILGSALSMRVHPLHVWGRPKNMYLRLMIRRKNPDPSWRTAPIHPRESLRSHISLLVKSSIQDAPVVLEADLNTEPFDLSNEIEEAMTWMGYERLEEIRHEGRVGPGWVRTGEIPSLRRSRAKPKAKPTEVRAKPTTKRTSTRSPSRIRSTGPAAIRRANQAVYEAYTQALGERFRDLGEGYDQAA